MPSVSSFTPTGRQQLGPASDLVELQDARGEFFTAIRFHPEYQKHNALNGALFTVLGFLESPLVMGLPDLIAYDLEGSTFVYPSGKAWSVAEIIQIMADQGHCGGPKAGMELLVAAGRILIEATEAGENAGIYSHMGLTPWRILISGKGEVQVIGYALPQVEILALQEDPKHVPGQDAFRYCPPERIAGKKENFSSDLFALALICFEFMTGKPVYNGLIDEIRQQAAAAETSLRLQSAGKELTDGIRALLRQLLRPVIGDRFRSPRDFIKAAEDASRGLGGVGLRELMLQTSKVIRAPSSRAEPVQAAGTQHFSRDQLMAVLGEAAEDAPKAARPRVETPASMTSSGIRRVGPPPNNRYTSETSKPSEPIELPAEVLKAPEPAPEPAKEPARPEGRVGPPPLNRYGEPKPPEPKPPEPVRPPLGVRPNARQSGIVQGSLSASLPAEPPIEPARPPLRPDPPPVEPSRPPLGVRPNARQSGILKGSLSASLEEAPVERPIDSLSNALSTPTTLPPPPVVAPPPPPDSSNDARMQDILSRVHSTAPASSGRLVAQPPPVQVQPVAPPPVQAQPVVPPVQAQPVVPPPVQAQPVVPPPVQAQPVVPPPVQAQPVVPPVQAQPVVPPPVQAQPIVSPPTQAPPLAPAQTQVPLAQASPLAQVQPPTRSAPPISRPGALATLAAQRPADIDDDDEPEEDGAKTRAIPIRRPAEVKPEPPKPEPPRYRSPEMLKSTAAGTTQLYRIQRGLGLPAIQYRLLPSYTLAEAVGILIGRMIPFRCSPDGRLTGWYRLGNTTEPLPADTRLESLNADDPLVLHPIEARILTLSLEIKTEPLLRLKIPISTATPCSALVDGLSAMLDLPVADWQLLVDGIVLGSHHILEDRIPTATTRLTLRRI